MMRKSLCFMRSRPLLSHLAWLKNLLGYNLYDTLWHIQGRSCRAQGRSCRAQGRSCRARGAAVGNIGIPSYVISRGAVVRQPLSYLVSKVLDLKDTATLQFTSLLFNYRSGILREN